MSSRFIHHFINADCGSDLVSTISPLGKVSFWILGSLASYPFSKSKGFPNQISVHQGKGLSWKPYFWAENRKLQNQQGLDLEAIQGDRGGLRLDFIDFNPGVLLVCPFAMPSLPNFHLPKANRADREPNKSKSTNLVSNHLYSLNGGNRHKEPIDTDTDARVLSKCDAALEEYDCERAPFPLPSVRSSRGKEGRREGKKGLRQRWKSVSGKAEEMPLS